MVNMKRVLHFFVIFLILSLIPTFAYAEQYDSKMLRANEILERMDFEKDYIIDLSATMYSNINLTGYPGVSFSASIYNTYKMDVDVKTILHLYDENKNLLGDYENIVSVKAKDNSLYKMSISEKNVKYKIEDIKYFSITIDFVTDIEAVENKTRESYYLDNYNIKINVNENNVYNVEENFSVVFKNNVIPIEKSIPLRNRYIRENGSRVNKRIVLDNIDMDDYYDSEIVSGIKKYTIGKVEHDSKNKDFKIKYDYNAGKDLLKNNDEFVYYLLNNSDVVVEGLSFEITMPKDFDSNKIQIVDENGILYNDISYNVEGNVIKGKIEGSINPEASYLVRIELNDKYFVNCSSNISIYTILSFVIPILFIILSFVILIASIKLSKNVKYKGDLYFTKMFNSLEMAYKYKGKVKDKDIASLVFWLAGKGYITIKKNKKDYSLIYKNKYVENNEIEKEFISKLFKDKKEIKSSELVDAFENVKKITVNELNKKNEEKKIFNTSIFSYKLMFILMVMNIFVINIINLLVEYQPSVILFNLIVSGLGYLILFGTILSKNKLLEKLLYTLVSLILIVVPVVLTSYQAFSQSYLFIVSYILSVFSMLAISIISKRMSDRTKYGNKVYKKINSYKNYLISCDDSIIDEEMKNNKNCLYDILPYTLVLGISEEWIDRFKNKNVSKPSWYDVDNFKLKDFYNQIIKIYSDIFLAIKNSDDIEE